MIMKKIFLMMAAALMLTACVENQPFQSETVCQDASSVVTDVIMNRRSIRAYKDSALSREVVDAILECGINAPSGMNLQSYEIRVINSPALLDSITAAVVHDNPKVGERPGFKNIFVNAPCVVFVANDTNYDLAKVDCGLLGQNIMLSAWSKGIGSCCLGMPVRMMKDSPSAQKYMDMLGFSAGFEFLYCIGLGYPDETPDAKPRSKEMIRYVE